MLNKKTAFLVVVFAVLTTLAVATGIAQAGENSASVNLDTQLAANVALDSVVIGEDHSVNFLGHAEDLNIECLPAQVFIDGEREAWWPVFRCVEVDESGGWMLRVPSDDGGSPQSIHFQIGE